MKKVGDWFVPNHMNSAVNHVRRSAVIDVALSYLSDDRHRVVVQAGGHIGIWPKTLSQHFGEVYTWEPMDENWECLVANLRRVTNVRSIQGCLGDKRADVKMVYSVKNTGKHCISPRGTVDTSVEQLDDYGLLRTKPIDAMFLDVEGYELMVLRGANRILRSSKPLLVLEENGLQKRYAMADKEVGEHLSTLGYKQMERWEEDVIYLHESRI